MKLDTGTLPYPTQGGSDTPFAWICSYPGCGIERNFMEHPNSTHRYARTIEGDIGTPRWAFGPEGWRRIHYQMNAVATARSIRVVCPDHAHIAGYGGLLDTPTLEAMMVLTVLLQG